MNIKYRELEKNTSIVHNMKFLVYWKFSKASIMKNKWTERNAMNTRGTKILYNPRIWKHDSNRTAIKIIIRMPV